MTDFKQDMHAFLLELIYDDINSTTTLFYTQGVI